MLVYFGRTSVMLRYLKNNASILGGVSQNEYNLFMLRTAIYRLNLGLSFTFSSLILISAAIPASAQFSLEYKPVTSQLAQNSEPPEEAESAPTPEDLTEPDETRSLVLSDSVLSLEGGERLMKEAGEAIDTEQYGLAVTKLKQSRKIFNQLSTFHLQLANSFSGIDSDIYESQRQSALKTGQLRDEATYRLALVHRAQNSPELAVPLLIQIIRSQNPTSELGRKSYQQLYELGFVSNEYNRTPAAPAPPTAPPANAPTEAGN